MGKVYKKKRRSCAMCKPHKMGWAPKTKEKYKEVRMRWVTGTTE